MPGYFVKTVHKGNKIYHINYGRIVMSVVLLLAVIVFGVCLLISGIRKNKANEQLASRFTLLSMSSVPKASEQTKQRCVVLDPGHGGTDPGTSAEGIDEKDINLSICLETEKILRAYGYTVLMTRRDDSDVDTMAVLNEAGEVHADLFVAVHQNAMENDTTTNGIETWYENKDDYSKMLAQCLQTAAVEATGAQDLGIKDSQSFMVTREATMPSALIETGFLTEPSEREKLNSRFYQQTIAQAIADGINDFFSQAQMEASQFDFGF